VETQATRDRAGRRASEPVIRLDGVTRTYEMGDVLVHALRGVDLELRRDECTVLLGPSGSGKSTLMNLLGGLDLPTAGSVWFGGRDLARASRAARTLYRREHVGFVFQFYNLLPSLTARENVQLVTDIAARPMRPEEALALVGLEARLDHFPSQLSGGEQQRVAIARAIAKRPTLLLCDEPTGSLDVATGRQVLAAIVRTQAELATSTVLITHNTAIAALADRVVHLADGRVRAIDDQARRTDPADISW
jgi:putative ABC transport system ATP-binding protein